MDPLIAARFPPLAALPPGAFETGATEQALAWAAPYGDYALEGVEVEEAAAPGPHGLVPVRVYRPTGAPAGLPGLVWVHGGGFISGDLDMVEAHVVAGELALRAGAVVVSVGYRLAAEGTRYPVPLDDVVAAWRWAVAGPIAGVPAAIGGGSAGANLAASAVLRLRAEGDALPVAVRLAYPAMHFPNPAGDDALAADLAAVPPVLRLTSVVVVALFREYLGRITAIPAGDAPGLADLTGFPPVRQVLSEVDDLRPSGELFALQLASCGVAVETTVAAGMLHGHLNLPPVAALPEVSRSIDFLATPWST